MRYEVEIPLRAPVLVVSIVNEQRKQWRSFLTLPRRLAANIVMLFLSL